MFYAIDAVPAYHEVAYEIAPVAAERSAKGFAALNAPKGYSGLQVTGARTHCVVRPQGVGGIAVCDDATIISFGTGKSGKARPAVLNAVPLAAVQPVPSDADRDVEDALPDAADLAAPARRWFADLLMTFGIGFLIVSCFLFVTSRDPLPTRRAEPRRI